MSMNIIPLSAPTPTIGTQSSSVPGASRASQIQGGLHDGVPFNSLLRNALANVQETQEVVRQDAIDLALGQVDDIAAVNINAARASLAFDLLVQLRNRVLEAYQEMMRMSV